MRTGPGKPGRAAEAFLLRSLRAGPVAVAELVSRVRRAGVSQATLYRAAERLGVTKPACWALPVEQSAPEQAIVEREAQVDIQGQVLAAVAETDRRVARAVAEVGKLIAEGLGRDSAIHRACGDDRELAARVLEKLAR